MTLSLNINEAFHQPQEVSVTRHGIITAFKIAIFLTKHGQIMMLIECVLFCSMIYDKVTEFHAGTG